MKKLYISLLAVMLAGCSAAGVSASAVSSSAEEEESGLILNTKELDMDGYWWLDDDDPAFIQISFTESFRLFEEGGTGMLVYSYPDCPYCNRAVPVLNEAAKEKGIKVYYVDVYEPEMTTDTTEEQFYEDLYHLYDLLDPILEKMTNETTGEIEPAFYVPEVVAIKDGEIVGHHCSLTDDFVLEDSETQMTDEQRQELKDDYLRLIDLVAAE